MALVSTPIARSGSLSSRCACASCCSSSAASFSRPLAARVHVLGHRGQQIDHLAILASRHEGRGQRLQALQAGRFDREELAGDFLGAGVVAEPQIGGGQQEQAAHVLRRRHQEFLQDVTRLGRPFSVRDVQQRRDPPEPQLAVGPLGRRQRLLVGGRRVGVALLPLEQIAERRVVPRIDLRRHLDRLDRGVHAAQRQPGFRQHGVGLGGVGRLRDDAFQDRHGAIGMAGAQLQSSERELQVEIGRRERRLENLRQVLDGRLAHLRHGLPCGRRRRRRRSTRHRRGRGYDALRDWPRSARARVRRPRWPRRPCSGAHGGRRSRRGFQPTSDRAPARA